MTTVSPLLHGLYPRSEGVVQATRDFDRGRAPWEEVAAAYDQQREEIQVLQREEGFPYVTAGQLDWPHYFHPFTEQPRVTEGELTRFVDTNTFFRRPRVEGGVPSASGAMSWYDDGGTVTLPGPHFFFRAAEELRAEDAFTVLPALYETVLSQLDADLVQYTEPEFAFNAAYDEFTALGVDEADYRIFDLYEPILDASSAEAVIHFPHGDVFSASEEVFTRALALPAAIGVDLYDREVFKEERLDELAAYDLADEAVYLGAVIGDATQPRNAPEMSQVVSSFLDDAAPETVYIGPNVELSLLPDVVARQKVEELGAVAEVLDPGGGKQ